MLSAVWYAIRKTENPFSAAETVRIVAVTAIKGGTLVPQREYIIRKLKERGCRITRQRLIILDIILQEDCSCCKEIYYKVQEKDRNIGPATIYRMVNMLEKIGAISRKNMYRISSCEACCQENGCTVRLSDDTVCKLPSEVWKQVVRAGLKNMGYIGDQDIESIEMTMSKCGA